MQLVVYSAWRGVRWSCARRKSARLSMLPVLPFALQLRDCVAALPRNDAGAPEARDDRGRVHVRNGSGGRSRRGDGDPIPETLIFLNEKGFFVNNGGLQKIEPTPRVDT